MPVIRRFSRGILAWSIGHTALCCGFVGAAYWMVDDQFKADLHNAHFVARVPYDTLWKRFSRKGKSLTSEERACAEAFESLMRFDLEHGAFNRFSPRATWHDPLIFFEGISELRDGWTFLRHWFTMTDPVCTDIRRSVDPQTGHVQLFVELETAAKAYPVPIEYKFLSHARLYLKSDEHNAGRLVIDKVEHRWFENEGPLVSRACGSMKTIVGDVGDLARRLNGFWLSSFVTTTHDSCRQE